jgi:WD40 repeat protein
LWDVVTGKMIHEFAHTPRPVTCVDFGPDEKLKAAGGPDRLVRLMDEADEKTLRGHGLAVNSLTFTPDGRGLASASDDNSIRLWNVATGRQGLILHGHTDDVTTIAASPDNMWLASGAKDKTVRLWSITGDKLKFTLFDPKISKKSKAREVKEMGKRIMTLPCGTPLPAGSICICNCVATSATYRGTEMVCTCDTVTVPASTPLSNTRICVCNTIHVGEVYYKRTSRPGSSRSYSTSYWYPN